MSCSLHFSQGHSNTPAGSDVSLAAEHQSVAGAQGIRGLQYSADQNSWFVQSGCLNIDSLPSIVLRFGSLPFALTPRQYISQVAPHSCVLALQRGTGLQPPGCKL